MSNEPKDRWENMKLKGINTQINTMAPPRSTFEIGRAAHAAVEIKSMSRLFCSIVDDPAPPTEETQGAFDSDGEYKCFLICDDPVPQPASRQTTDFENHRTAGDVMQYLEQFGEVTQDGPAYFNVDRGLFGVSLRHSVAGWNIWTDYRNEDEGRWSEPYATLEIAMDEAIRLFKDAVAASLPPEEPAPAQGRQVVTRYIGTGHMGGPGTGSHR